MKTLNFTIFYGSIDLVIALGIFLLALAIFLVRDYRRGLFMERMRFTQARYHGFLSTYNSSDASQKLIVNIFIEELGVYEDTDAWRLERLRSFLITCYNIDLLNMPYFLAHFDIKERRKA